MKGQMMAGRGSTFTTTDTLFVETCPACGVLFALPNDLVDHLRERGDTFYCPNGHGQHYQSENAKLRQQLDAERTRVQRLREEVEHERKRHSATKGELTKIRRRAARGVCPCCKRSFVNVANHVQTKHPGFVEETKPS